MTPRSYAGDYTKAPVVLALAILAFLNWFVFAGISIYIGGDAIGTLPSTDGFIVESHGQRTVVSEAVWLFSLFYSGGTLLLTPAIWPMFAARNGSEAWKKTRWQMRLAVGGFLCIWALGWYSSVGGSVYRS